jgi:hypothetical protein
MVQVGGQNIEGCFKQTCLVFSLEPNLAKPSCGSLLLWLHHKIDSPHPKKRKRKKPKKTLKLAIKSWPVRPEFTPSYDASPPPGCCPQSHEILLN